MRFCDRDCTYASFPTRRPRPCRACQAHAKGNITLEEMRSGLDSDRPSWYKLTSSAMKIDTFIFGAITIEGKTYTKDVLVFPDRVSDDWRREEEHRPQISEFAEIVKAEPEILIIGTGYAGVMSIPDQIRNYLTSKGIEVRVDKTARAVDLYNSLRQNEKVIAAFHITC